MAEAGAERADVVIAVTGDDEDNLVICQVAKKRFGSKRTIARINDPRNEGLFRMLGIDATVNATELLLSVLEQQIPEVNLVPLLRLASTDVEVVHAFVGASSQADGRAISDLGLPEESTVTLVVRGGKHIFPTPATVLQRGDEVVALTRPVHEARLRSVFQAGQ
jgi:trk system potassium uptake protein TrkA